MAETRPRLKGGDVCKVNKSSWLVAVGPVLGMKNVDPACNSHAHADSRNKAHKCERGRHGSKSLLSFEMDRGHAWTAFLDLITRMLRAVYYALLYRRRADRAELPLGRPREFIKKTSSLYRPSANYIIYTLTNYFLPLMHRGCNFTLWSSWRGFNEFQTINVSLRPVKGGNFILRPLYQYISFIVFHRTIIRPSEDMHCRHRQFKWTFQRLLGRTSSLGMSGILFNRPRILSCSWIVLSSRSKGVSLVSEMNEKNSVPV